MNFPPEFHQKPQFSSHKNNQTKHQKKGENRAFQVSTPLTESKKRKQKTTMFSIVHTPPSPRTTKNLGARAPQFLKILNII
jgi:hypothetical protein